MSHYTACVDPEYIELIVKSVLQDKLACHELQAGLQDCDSGWLGHESRVVLCDTLIDLVQDAVDDGSLTGHSESPIKGSGSEDDPYTLDEDKLRQIVADVFKNSEGNALPEGTLLLSKDEIEHAIEDAKEELDNKIPVVVDSEGNAFSSETKVYSTSEVDDNIESAKDSLEELIGDADPELKDSEGNDLPKGTELLTQEETEHAISDLKDDIEGQLECGLNNGVHTDDSLTGDGTCDDYMGVDETWLEEFLADTVPTVQIEDCPVGDKEANGNASPMSETEGTELPTTIIGSKNQSDNYTRAAILGKPDKFMKVKLPGDCGDETFYIPLFKA